MNKCEKIHSGTYVSTGLGLDAIGCHGVSKRLTGRPRCRCGKPGLELVGDHVAKVIGKHPEWQAIGDVQLVVRVTGKEKERIKGIAEFSNSCVNDGMNWNFHLLWHLLDQELFDEWRGEAVVGNGLSIGSWAAVWDEGPVCNQFLERVLAIVGRKQVLNRLYVSERDLKSLLHRCDLLHCHLRLQMTWNHILQLT